MKLYSEGKNYKLYQGNMLDMLDVIEENSIDAIVTDPPYELGFMGKSWDKSGIAFQKETWEKCFRVLKPGGHLLAFGGSRTFHRIACAIEDAGFEIRDTIMWLYGSGFPKSMDISKQIDKKGGNDYSKQFAIDLKQARESRNLTMKYCDDKYCNGSTNWSWYEGRKDGCRVPDYQTYLEIIKEFPELEKYKELIKEAEREVIGTTIANKTIYQRIGDKNISGEIDMTIPSTDLAKKWKGWGTALKPSYEPIIVARKPVENTVVENVLKYGVGGINIDECRVAFNGDKWGTQRSGKTSRAYQSEETTTAGGLCEANENGRFPANTILTYDDNDYDEVCGGFPNVGQQSKNGTPYNYAGKEYSNKDSSMFNGDKPKSPSNYNDSGSASRYFYCAKASKRDREEGFEELEQLNNGRFPANTILTYDETDFDEVCGGFPIGGKNGSITNPNLNNSLGNGGIYGKYSDKQPTWNAYDDSGSAARYFYCAKASKRDRNEGLPNGSTNIHTTVKPVSLMQYLIRLVTPNGGVVLDPFNGSGSTGKAVMWENRDNNKNYSYIGIELTEEYLPIAKARIEYSQTCKEEPEKNIKSKSKVKEIKKNTNKLF